MAGRGSCAAAGDFGVDAEDVAHGVAADFLEEAFGRAECAPEAEGVVFGADPVVAGALFNDATEWVAVEGEGRGVVFGLEHRAVGAVAVRFFGAVAVLDGGDAT